MKSKILALLIVLSLVLAPLTTYAEIRYNPETDKIEMTIEDYTTLIDTIREYEAKLNLYEEQLKKERALFEELKISYEGTLKICEEALKTYDEKMKDLITENQTLHKQLYNEKVKSQTKTYLIIGLIITCVVAFISN